MPTVFDIGPAIAAAADLTPFENLTPDTGTGISRWALSPGGAPLVNAAGDLVYADPASYSAAIGCISDEAVPNADYEDTVRFQFKDNYTGGPIAAFVRATPTGIDSWYAAMFDGTTLSLKGAYVRDGAAEYPTFGTLTPTLVADAYYLLTVGAKGGEVYAKLQRESNSHFLNSSNVFAAPDAKAISDFDINVPGPQRPACWVAYTPADGNFTRGLLFKRWTAATIAAGIRGGGLITLNQGASFLEFSSIPANGGTGPYTYEAFTRLTSGGAATSRGAVLAADLSRFRIEGLEPETEYFVFLRATDALAATGDSAELAVTTAATDPDKIIVLHGNSLMKGYNRARSKTFGELLRLAFLGEALVYNLSTNGATWQDLIDDAPAQVDPYYDESMTANILLCLEGPNSMIGGQTAVQAAADAQEYIDARDVVGWDVVPFTMPSASGVSGGNKTTYNTALAAGNAVVVDAGADARLSNTADTAYFDPDALHTNDGGNEVFAELAEPVVQARMDAADEAAAEDGADTGNPRGGNFGASRDMISGNLRGLGMALRGLR